MTEDQWVIGPDANVPRETSGVAEALEGWVERMKTERDRWPKCASCGEPSRYVEDGRCVGCAAAIQMASEREAWARGMLAAIDRAADSWLMHRAGLSPREVGARVERIPASISSAVTRSLVMLMVDPRDLTPIAPTHGFGLAGNAGVGKTFAIAAWMRAAFVTRVNRFAKSDGRQVARRWLRWVRWPEMVSTWRSEATIDNGYLRATEFAKELGEAEALVIDDLGAERMKGAYTDDWTISLLDLVIDRRYNERRPTWYTTNLSRAAFAERYGARFYSRLCMANPLFEISGAKDLRGELGR